MHERKGPREGDVHATRQGDIPPEALSGGFSDWDNPEDAEDAPEGYYDDEDSYVPGPDDPDYDLSEAAGYAGWEAPQRRSLIPQWLIVVASLLLILALVVPVLLSAR